MKQKSTCTGLLQQWHKPKAAGRSLQKSTVNDMLGIGVMDIEPNPAVTNFYFDLFSKGNEIEKLKNTLCRLWRFFVSCFCPTNHRRKV